MPTFNLQTQPQILLGHLPNLSHIQNMNYYGMDEKQPSTDDILMSRILNLLTDLLDYYEIPRASQMEILDEISNTIDELIAKNLPSTTESSEIHSRAIQAAVDWIKSKS